MTRWEIYFSGTVQGVGFRYTSSQQARQQSVVGWVANLDDGRVKMVIEGKPGDLQQFVDSVRDATHGHVTDVAISSGEPTGEFHDFHIRPTGTT